MLYGLEGRLGQFPLAKFATLAPVTVVDGISIKIEVLLPLG